MIMSDSRNDPTLNGNNRFYTKYTGESYGDFVNSIYGPSRTRVLEEVCAKSKDEPILSPDTKPTDDDKKPMLEIKPVVNEAPPVQTEAAELVDQVHESFGSRNMRPRPGGIVPRGRPIKLPQAFCNETTTNAMEKIQDYLTGYGKPESEKNEVEHFCTEHWENVASSIIIIIVIVFISIAIMALVGMVKLANCMLSASCECDTCPSCGMKCGSLSCKQCHMCPGCCICKQPRSQGLNGGDLEEPSSVDVAPQLTGEIF